MPHRSFEGDKGTGERHEEPRAAHAVVNEPANGALVGHPRPHNEMHDAELLLTTEARRVEVDARVLAEGRDHRDMRRELPCELHRIGREVSR
jgi:hypothetical protein